MQFLAPRWMAEPHHYFLRISSRNILEPQGPVPPLSPRRLPFSPVNAYLGTLGICPNINSVDGYCYNHGGSHVGYLATPDLAYQYHFLAPGKPLVPSGELP